MYLIIYPWEMNIRRWPSRLLGEGLQQSPRRSRNKHVWKWQFKNIPKAQSIKLEFEGGTKGLAGEGFIGEGDLCWGQCLYRYGLNREKFVFASLRGLRSRSLICGGRSFIVRLSCALKGGWCPRNLVEIYGCIEGRHFKLLKNGHGSQDN